MAVVGRNDCRGNDGLDNFMILIIHGDRNRPDHDHSLTNNDDQPCWQIAYHQHIVGEKKLPTFPTISSDGDISHQNGTYIGNIMVGEPQTADF